MTERTVFQQEMVSVFTAHNVQMNKANRVTHGVMRYPTGMKETRKACFYCDFHGSLNKWQFDPQWVFGNLGFSFHNWDIRDNFIEEFEQILGSKIIAVYQHD